MRRGRENNKNEGRRRKTIEMRRRRTGRENNGNVAVVVEGKQ